MCNYSWCKLKQLALVSESAQPQIQMKPPHCIPVCKFCNSLPSYAPELWSQFAKTDGSMPETPAQHLQSNQSTTYIISEASQNAQHCRALSWIIAMSTHELWRGSGTVLGPQHNAHSGWAKGSGLLAALTILAKYLQNIPIHLPPVPIPIQCSAITKD